MIDAALVRAFVGVEAVVHQADVAAAPVIPHRGPERQQFVCKVLSDLVRSQYALSPSPISAHINVTVHGAKHPFSAT